MISDILPYTIGHFIVMAIAWVILSCKNRGAGYYFLAFLLPLVGLIVAFCLKFKFDDDDDKTPTPTPTQVPSPVDNTPVTQAPTTTKKKKNKLSSTLLVLLAIITIPVIIFIFMINHSKIQNINHSKNQDIVPEEVKVLSDKLVAQIHSPIKCTTLTQYTPPKDWRRYEIDGSFTISLPPTMELRTDADKYTQTLKNMNISLNNSNVVFQQRGLATQSRDAYKTYCRVLAIHAKVTPGDVDRYDQTSFTYYDCQELKELVDIELGPSQYIQTPTFQYVDIGGTKAIQAKYKRTGTEGPIICRWYLFQNYDEVVKIVTAYRESDAKRWRQDINQIIKTFKWNNPK